MKALKSAVLLLATLSSLQGAAMRQTETAGRPHSVWDTCVYVEGKSEICRSGEIPRKFEEYLRPDWLKEPVDGFSVNTGLDRLQSNKDTFKASWSEIGGLGSSRIRLVEYQVNSHSVSAFVIFAERKDGLFAPLMKWNGTLPDIKVFRTGAAGVLGFSRDFGGNVPMVTNWAWTATNSGPLQLDIDHAVGAAIRKISPVHSCYRTDFDWSNLHVLTWCWPGEYINKPGVKYEMNAWFEFKNGELAPIRVELRNIEELEPLRRWP